MALQQKVPQFMGEAEPGGWHPPLGVDQDLALGAKAVGQQHAFKTVELFIAYVGDVEAAGDLINGDSALQWAHPAMNGLRQLVGLMDVGQINAIKLQGFTPRRMVGRHWPASTLPSSR
ncbi:hypothetical protein GCM10007315_25590 [Gemmobacter tilapiae]|uniref:Uncharacterized protein n=1 Tax=Neogemmobacter tilapiae TaxID=875041 RepID=A0A918TUH9_9RHOB|nr:hypothetical protein GCM10007315_25590 [Gemmobacter tilapiae]